MENKVLQKTHIPALLLAAGIGSRLAPLTDNIPKCLVPILGRPLLDFWLEKCVKANMSPIIINTSYLPKTVEIFINNSQYKDMIIISHEEKLLGTGGTILASEKYLNGNTFFVAHADNLSFFDMNDFYVAHANRPSHAILSAMIFRTPRPKSCGIVELDDRGIVTAFHEKVDNPPSDLANGAVYFMQPVVFSILKECQATYPYTNLDISQHLLPNCLGHINTYLNNDYHRDIGTPESYAKAQDDMKIRFSHDLEKI